MTSIIPTGFTKFRTGCRIITTIIAMLSFFMPARSLTTYETGQDDGLALTVDNGRVTGLSIGGQTIQLGGETGGFYVRDYTLDPNTGLPADLDAYGNLLGCSTFEGSSAGEPECSNCLSGVNVWKIAENVPGILQLLWCTDVTIGSIQTTVAEIRFPKDPTPTTYYIGIYQDIDISSYYGSMPDTHDLFCFAFDLATACGFRLKDHPEGWAASDLTKSTYGPHEIKARIDWYDSESDLNGMPFKPSYTTAEDTRIGRTEANIWESTNDAAVPPPYTDPTDMTSCGLRSYRPREANWVRVGVIIRGHMPNDGVPDFDHAYFDNFAFYKAPEMVPVRTDVLLEGSASKLLKKVSDGTNLTTCLKMRAGVDVVQTTGRDCLLVRGEIENADFNLASTLPPRALDIGFALPISGSSHDLVWWDDMRHSEDVYSNSNLLPFRMTGAIDSRPDLSNTYDNYSNEQSNLRGESTQVSAYPFSALDINTSGGIRALSFGDNLDATSVSVSHFGYRVTEPDENHGEYYIEFRLGALEEGTTHELSPGNQVRVDKTPFSFIIFRSDDPNDITTNNFRIAADDYQTDLFPDFFTRPEPPQYSTTEQDWAYGGAFYQVEFVEDPGPPPSWSLATNTFNNNTEMYGLRYTQERYTGLELDMFEDQVNACNGVEVSTLIYRQPWQAKFLNETGTEMNHFYTLCQSRNDFTIPWDDPWPAIYAAQKEYQLKLPTGLDLFSNNIIPDDKNIYQFPVLLADDSFGTLDLLHQERQYIVEANDNIGVTTNQGLEGIELDNTFFGASGANHLHCDPNHLRAFVGAKNGTLTYSINYLEPAIPQLAANVWYLKEMSLQLDDIDDVPPTGDGFFGDGLAGNTAGANLDHELLSVNANEPDYGGSKYGIMLADIGGFESSVESSNNRRDRSQNFRRAMARDKNMSRLISEIEFTKCLIDGWSSCPRWSTLWNDTDSFRLQMMYEAAWISLAWGFMPSITAMFPGDDAFYDAYVKPIFGDDTIPRYGRALTSIFRDLHLAGWRPRNQVEAEYIYNKDDVELYVERYGDVGWGGNAVYFTVLNNDDLSLSAPKMAKMYATEPHAEKSLDEILTAEEFEEYEICEKDLACDDFPEDCPTELTDDLHKDFFLHIHNASSLGLMFGVGNLTGIQLIYRPENSAVCNWSAVRDWQFTEGYPSQYYSLLRIISSDTIELGGPWEIMLNRESLSIPDKVLYVFKLWRENKVDNGDGGEEGGRSESEGTRESMWRGARYERYGSGWQTYDTAGYNGSVDSVAVADRQACAYYAINTGTGGELEILAHFPITSQATTAAQYDVYITDYLEDTTSGIDLGDSILTRIIDQTDAAAYSTAADQEGFITIGTVDVSLAPRELKTIVVRLSPARDQASINPSALLVADAVMVREIEQDR